MCFPGALGASSEGSEGRRWAPSRAVQALRDYRSPLQLRKAIQKRCSELGLGEGLHSVTSLASARVRRVTRWVFTLNFTKIFLPLLLAGFLSALHPHTEIQLGVLAGIVVFTFAFLLATRTILPAPVLTARPEVSKAEPVPALPDPAIVLRLYRLLPLPLISALWGWAAALPLPAPLDRLSIQLYATMAKCNVHEAEHADLSEYKTVSDFFTRRLRADARPVCPLSALVSPADGTLTCSGPVEGPYLQQVKGVTYSLHAFLGGGLGLEGKQLSQAVVYLSPSDYHRFHSPADWTVTARRHFPGALCSVHPAVVARVPGLFHTNERAVWLGTWAHGFMAMVAVGATNVGSIVAEFDPELRTNQNVGEAYCHQVEFQKPVNFKKGDDFGYFNFGSTMVVIFEVAADTALKGTEGPSRILMGQGLLA